MSDPEDGAWQVVNPLEAASTPLTVVSRMLFDPIDSSVPATLPCPSACSRLPSVEAPGSFAITWALLQRSLCTKPPAMGAGQVRTMEVGLGSGEVPASPSSGGMLCPCKPDLHSAWGMELLAFALKADLGLQPLSQALVHRAAQRSKGGACQSAGCGVPRLTSPLISPFE